MNLLFAGTPDIAVPSLRKAAARFPVVGVLTAPDAVSGRGRKVSPPPVKVAAEDLGLPVLQPDRLDGDARAAVRRLEPAMLVAFAYGKIFGPKFLGLFTEGGINVHPSLLPKYRGPSPIPAVILAGESETGITIQYLAEKMDAGAVIARERIALSGDETTESLSALVAERAADLLVEAISRIEEGAAEPEPQNEAEATYCTLIRKEDGEIDWATPAERIERMVRAYTPWPGAYTYWGDRKLTIREAAVYGTADTGAQLEARDAAPAPPADAAPVFPADAAPGHVLGVDRRRGILIQTGRGVLAVRRLQLQAGQAVDWKSFINGHRDLPGTVLGG
ncbi:MAG: methionyl-tRNA formyltransferase [Spirochaetaceae bacterium]